jgi:hypothetical protein
MKYFVGEMDKSVIEEKIPVDSLLGSLLSS